MERREILDLMSQLQLFGMRTAYDEIVTAGVKRNSGMERVIASLLQAEIAAKQARVALKTRFALWQLSDDAGQDAARQGDRRSRLLALSGERRSDRTA